MATRITTLISRAASSTTSHRASARLRKTQQKLSSGKELTRPSDDPPPSAARCSCAREMEGDPAVPAQRLRGAGLGRRHRQRAETIGDALQRVRELAVQGAQRTPPAGSRARRSPRRSAASSTASRPPATPRTAAATSSPARRPTRRRTRWAPTTPTRRHRADRPPDRPGRHRRRQRRRPRGHRRRRRGLLATPARRPRRTSTATTAAALPADARRARPRLDELNAVRAHVGATCNRLEVADGAPGRVRGHDAQAALRDRGRRHRQDDDRLQRSSSPRCRPASRPAPSIVQNSLLDFLR